MKHLKRKNGFSLVGVIVIALVIGILAAFVIPLINTAVKRTNTAAPPDALRAIRKAADEAIKGGNPAPTLKQLAEADKIHPVFADTSKDKPFHGYYYELSYANGVPIPTATRDKKESGFYDLILKEDGFIWFGNQGSEPSKLHNDQSNLHLLRGSTIIANK